MLQKNITSNLEYDKMAYIKAFTHLFIHLFINYWTTDINMV